MTHLYRSCLLYTSDLAQSESFPSVTSTNITEVEVNNGGNIYTLTKDDSSNWQVSDNTGKGYSAEYQTVSTLNSTIAGMTFAGLADIQTEDLGRYGLEHPAAVIHVTYTEEVEAEKTEESESTDSSGGESDEGAQNETVIKELDIYVGAQDEAVSYTHLDVYKRQEQHCGPDAGGFLFN